MSDRLAALVARSTTKYPGMISVPEGWEDLVIELDTALAEIDPDYTIFQVKEKFAGLRYYYHSTKGEQMEPLVQEAEQKSATICQKCGQPAAQRCKPSGWWATLCEAHADGAEIIQEEDD